MPEEVRAKQRSNREFSRRQFLQYSAAGLSAALLTACAPVPATTGGGAAPAANTSSGEAAASGTPTQGGIIRLMGHQEVAGMGPNDATASVQQVVIYAIHNSLLMLDEKLASSDCFCGRRSNNTKFNRQR